MPESLCPACGAARQGDDRFCHRCGGSLPPIIPAVESAPVGGTSPAAAETTAGWSDFFLHPARLFAHGQPPVWGVALALVALVGLGSGAINAVGQAGMERMLPDFISAANLPTEISDQIVKAMAANEQQALGRTAGVLIGLAYSIPFALAGYLIMSGIFFGLGRWAGGRGGWEAFTRNYALLAIPEIPVLVVNMFAVALMLAPVPPVLLLLAGLLVLAMGTVAWAWKIWLRYALLTGNLQVASGRAAAIVAGWEMLKIALVTLLAGAVLIVVMLLAVAGH